MQLLRQPELSYPFVYSYRFISINRITCAQVNQFLCFPINAYGDNLFSNRINDLVVDLIEMNINLIWTDERKRSIV